MPPVLLDSQRPVCLCRKRPDLSLGKSCSTGPLLDVDCSAWIGARELANALPQSGEVGFPRVALPRDPMHMSAILAIANPLHIPKMDRHVPSARSKQGTVVEQKQRFLQTRKHILSRGIPPSERLRTLAQDGGIELSVMKGVLDKGIRSQTSKHPLCTSTNVPQSTATSNNIPAKSTAAK
jgi:hypothetical protein